MLQAVVVAKSKTKSENEIYLLRFMVRIQQQRVSTGSGILVEFINSNVACNMHSTRTAHLSPSSTRLDSTRLDSAQALIFMRMLRAVHAIRRCRHVDDNAAALKQQDSRLEGTMHRVKGQKEEEEAYLYMYI